MKIIKDSFIYIAGELVSKSMPFLLLPYLSRKLGVEGFGELSYYQTFTVLFFIIISLSQEGAITRYFYLYGKRSLHLIVSAGYFYSLNIGLLILISCWIAQSEILIYISTSAIFQSLLNVQLSIRQCQKQVIPYTAIQFILSISTVIYTIILLEYFEKNLVEKRILAILLGYITIFIISYLLYHNKIKLKKFKFKQYKLALIYLIGFGLPLILHNISLFLKGQLDRIFIFHQFSQAELGLYAMGVQIANILMIVLQAINKATIPYFFEGLKKQHITINHIHRWTLSSLFFVPIPSIIVWFLPETLFTYILGNQFIGTKYYIICFLISIMLIIPYFILVNYLFYFSKNKLISISSIISTITYVISLTFLSITQIEYIPFASIIGSITILPILFIMTKTINNEK